MMYTHKAPVLSDFKITKWKINPKEPGPDLQPMEMGFIEVSLKTTGGTVF